MNVVSNSQTRSSVYSKFDGDFIYVTYRQPHSIEPLLNCEDLNWDIQLDIPGGSESSFDYSGFVLKNISPPTESSAQVEKEKETRS